jgi:hypothetical protein
MNEVIFPITAAAQTGVLKLGSARSRRTWCSQRIVRQLELVPVKQTSTQIILFFSFRSKLRLFMKLQIEVAVTQVEQSVNRERGEVNIENLSGRALSGNQAPS